jgi:hypothetical protein
MKVLILLFVVALTVVLWIYYRPTIEFASFSSHF